MQINLHGSLGLAQRAGRVCSGQDAVREAFVSKNVYLLLIAQNAAERTREEFVRIAEQKGVPWQEPGTKQEYGSALGKPDRAVVAVLDKGFALSMIRKINGASGGMPQG